MRINQTSQVITASVIGLSLLAIGCALWSLHLRNQQEQAYETRRQAKDMVGQLAAGSDRLTAAVGGYAATGDRRYYDAFQRELTVDRTRDQALERLQQLGLSEAESALLTSAKQNSDALVSLENKVMEAVARSNLTEAISLVFGEDYRKAKEAIMQPIAESRSLLEARLTRVALITCGREKSNFCYETRQLVSLILFSFLGAWRGAGWRLQAAGCRGE